MKWSDQDILKSIKSGREEGLIALYKSHRQEFTSWVAGTYQVDQNLAADAFQEAILAFRQNVAFDKYQPGSGSIKTYLFAIGKNWILTYLKRRKLGKDKAEEMAESVTPKQELSGRQLGIRDAVSKLTEPCLSIIRYFYYDGLPMEVIAQRLKYKNEKVVKSQKVRCMQKLRELAMVQLQK